ncbi:DUF3732 domain-containing protein [Flavobacterium sp.]|uniref:DUF3732 domain-containing protein n=1 Tax=Flavobacterium sp. TaxID=239 RepID=UPI0022BE2C65|nr:DUF3732 domain-containing protein [Flavobacterium sp.]MCZ8090289.1 DUF3732 domain-containing protein [Flavobacterium sp.]
MNIHISRIFLFDNEAEKRTVKLNEGLNIITGDSKTGKSAIIEIVDYCLFSSRSTIPKGIINNWVDLFCIVLKTNDKFIIIARPSSKSIDGNKTYFNIETDDKFLENFDKTYFDKIELKNVKENQIEFEKHIGLSVIDTRTDEDDKKESGKATMRSFIPFLFQHQNLIANKHSLFYRFDDYYKRKKTIEDYSILMGWETNKFFMLKRELEEKTKRLLAEKKIIDKMKIDNQQLETKLFPLINSYFNFIGQNLEDNLQLKELKRIALNLPDVTKKSFSNSEVKLIYDKHLTNRNKLKNELDEILQLLEKLKSNYSLSNDYDFNIKKLKSFVSFDNDINDLTCPLCNHEVNEINSTINKVKESKEKLIEEFEKIGNYTNDSTQQIEYLIKERDKLKKEINQISIEISKIEKQLSENESEISFFEKAYILKGATKANVENLLERSNLSKINPDLIVELESDIKKIKEELEGYNIETLINEAEIILNNKMTEICDKLDFEKELKPGKLLFSFKDFSFKYSFTNNENKKENILLTEMGSGSNWLAIHLSVFLGFLYLNSIYAKSTIPSILILDQPSQVYFPSQYGKLNKEDIEQDTEEPIELSTKIDENIEQVKNIFRVLIEMINEIYKEAKYKPQIIVLEHADEEEFDDFVNYRWKKEGEKLI